MIKHCKATLLFVKLSKNNMKSPNSLFDFTKTTLRQIFFTYNIDQSAGRIS